MVDIERKPRRAGMIDMTPLIDIVFQLILFFMLTTSFIMTESLELSLPSAQQIASDSERAEVMRIVVSADDALTLNGRSVTKAELEDELVSRIAKQPDSKILVLSAEKVTVQELVTVMDIVYLSGGRNIAVAKE